MGRSNNQKGFTLVEMLVVLSIFILVSSVGYFPFQSYYEKKQLDYFVKRLEQDLLFTQLYAISHEKITTLDVYGEFYTIRNALNEPMILRRYYPKEFYIEFYNVNMGKKMIFLANGNIYRSGTVRIHYKNKKRKMVFQLGKGRFYCE